MLTHLEIHVLGQIRAYGNRSLVTCTYFCLQALAETQFQGKQLNQDLLSALDNRRSTLPKGQRQIAQL
jgi:hypothetical protein